MIAAEEPAELRVVVAVWRQVAFDLRSSDGRTRAQVGAWLGSPACHHWARLWDPALDPHLMIEALLARTTRRTRDETTARKETR